VFVLLNPSVADERKNDPTITRCVGFARSWGGSRLDVVNLYAWCATDPDDLRQAIDPVGPGNDATIKLVVAGADLVMCAWGSQCWDPTRIAAVRAIAGPEARALKINADGSPGHPLYIAKSTLPTTWKGP
jgi:hypothetical protein